MHLQGIVSLMLLLFFGACSSDEENLSAIRYLESSTYIQYLDVGADDNIVCIGAAQKGAWLEHTGYLFDRQLNLRKRIVITDLPGYDGSLHFKSLENDGWIVSSIVNKDKHGKITIHRTDPDFNIQQSVLLAERSLEQESQVFGAVYDILQLKNGDIGILWNESVENAPYIEESHIRMTRMSPDLEVLWTFEGSDTNVTLPELSPWSLTAIELSNGNIAYSHNLFGPPPSEANLVYGCLNPKGELIYQKFITNEPLDYVTSIHAGKNDEVFVSTTSGFNLRGTPVLRPYFLGFEGQSGKWIGSRTLSNDILTIDQTGSTPFRDRFGMFFYAFDLNKVFWGELNSDMEFRKVFYPTLPNLEYVRINHLRTKENTIILALNYRHNETNRMELMECDLEGNLVTR